MQQVINKAGEVVGYLLEVGYHIVRLLSFVSLMSRRLIYGQS